MKFIKERLSKDNLWNLVFWLGMIVSASFIDLFADFIPILALLFFILTLTLVPYFLSKLNKVSYTENKIFVNKQGQSLEDRYPTKFGLVLALTIPISIMLFFAVDKNLPLIKNLMFVYTAISLFIPTLYFIIKNCPISILFNKNAWCEEVTGIKPTPQDTPATIRSDDMFTQSTDPKYYYLSYNIHHKK